MNHVTLPVAPEWSDSLRRLPQGVRVNHVTSPVVPEYSDSLGQVPQGMRAKHVTSPVVPEYSDSLGTGWLKCYITLFLWLITVKL